MVHILHIDSSIKGEHSVTRQLTANVVTKLKQHYSDLMSLLIKKRAF